MTEFSAYLKNSNIVKEEYLSGQADLSSYQKYIQVYLVNDNKILIKQYSNVGSRINKGLFDVAMKKEIGKDQDFFDTLIQYFKEFTGDTLIFEDNNQDDSRCVYMPRVYVNHSNKSISYIYFIKSPSKPLSKYLQDSIQTTSFIDLEEFVQIFFSPKFVSYDEAYVETIRQGLCELLNIKEAKKNNRYRRIFN